MCLAFFAAYISCRNHLLSSCSLHLYVLYILRFTGNSWGSAGKLWSWYFCEVSRETLPCWSWFFCEVSQKEFSDPCFSVRFAGKLFAFDRRFSVRLAGKLFPFDRCFSVRLAGKPFAFDRRFSVRLAGKHFASDRRSLYCWLCQDTVSFCCMASSEVQPRISFLFASFAEPHF